MSAILAGLVGVFARELISYVGGLIQSYFAKVEKDRADHAAAVAQAAQDNEKATHITEGSKSDEVDSSIDDSLRHL